MRAASAMASTPGCRRVAFPRAATRATAATRWRAVQAPRILRNVAGLVRRCPSARAASCGDESSRNAVAGDEDKETSTSETTVSTSEPTVTRIPRAEALRRMDASISRRPSLSVFLEALDTTSRAAQLPPERCVWHNKLWKYATRAWSFPELLAALKTLDGAGFAEAVRLCGENQSVGTTTQLFREGASLGWCSDDGGASITAMAWTHDTHSQGALADRLWHELHDLAEKGKIDTSAIRKAGGVPDWDLRTWKKKNGQSKSKSKSKTPKFSPRVEVFMLEVASKARRRFRAACVVYTRLRDGDLLAQIDEDVGVVLSHNSTVTSDTSTACATQNQNRNKKSVHKKETETETERGWPGAARGSCRVKLPRRVFTAACRAAVGSRDVVFAKRIAIDMAADDVKYDSYTVAALTSLLGSSGNATDQDTAFAVFVSARDAPDTQLGGAAWSCAIGGLCRAGRLDKAIELLREMGNEPFMAGGVAAGKGNETDDDEDGTGDDVDENQTNSESEETKKSNHNLFAARRTSHAKAARVAARERAAAAPAYAQLVHALCDANRPADALGVHDEMTLAGVYAPANPPHYRALFKALCLGGGPGGGAMAPRKAAAAAVADAVRAATAASKAQSKRTARKDSFDAVDAVDAVDDDGASRGDGTDDVSTSPCTADAAAVRDAASSPSRGMAAAMSLTQSKFAGHAIRCTLQIAAEGGFPDVSSEARARLRWARVDPAPTDLELTLEAYSNAGDPRGAVAHWNANRRALLAEAEARRVDDGTGTSSLGNNGNTPTSWEVGADGVVVLGCKPSRRAWTAIIKAHCDLDEPSDAAALLREAVESEARRDSRAGGAFGLGVVGAGGAPGEGARSRRRDETQTTNREQTNMKAPSPQKQKQKPSDANKLRGVERVAFNLVAACYSRARAPRRAEDLLWLMDAAGVAPDAVTYNTVIGAYAAAARPPPSGGSAGRYRRLGYQSGLAINSGVGAMDDMIELALDTDVRFACASLGSSSVDGTLGVTKTFAPDEEFTEHDGGSTHEEESCVESCFRLLLEMRSKRAGALVPTIRTWTAVLTACARSGDVDNANEAFDRMRASGVVADRNAWTALIKAHASGGDTRGAAEAYWKMRASGIGTYSISLIQQLFSNTRLTLSFIYLSAGRSHAFGGAIGGPGAGRFGFNRRRRRDGALPGRPIARRQTEQRRVPTAHRYVGGPGV